MQIEHKQNAEDKRTQYLVDAGEKPQCGENPFINSSYYSSTVQQREGERVQISDLLAQKSVIKINSQQESITALTRKSTLVKSTPKSSPSCSVNKSPIRPSRRVKDISKTVWSNQSNTILIYAVKYEVNACQTVSITSISMPINAASKDRNSSLKIKVNVGQMSPGQR